MFRLTGPHRTSSVSSIAIPGTKVLICFLATFLAIFLT